jgi:Phage integrase family
MKLTDIRRAHVNAWIAENGGQASGAQCRGKALDTRARRSVFGCGRHRLGPLFELAVYTGLRRGEIAGLHWNDVDLAARTITVRHNRGSVDGRVQETTTKTRSGHRIVDLSDAGVPPCSRGSFARARSERPPRRHGWAMGTSSRWRTDGH